MAFGMSEEALAALGEINPCNFPHTYDKYMILPVLSDPGFLACKGGLGPDYIFEKHMRISGAMSQDDSLHDI